LLAEEFFRQPPDDAVKTPDFVKLIYVTSPLHDIGKVGIPDAVLLKPGRLTPEEMEVMKRHTTIGAETLDAALRESPGSDFLVTARDIALTHHERFDGGGYPRGIAGVQIPLAGRIVAVADVYDAIRSKRVYKPSQPHAQACETIVENRGKHFDPKLIDAFLVVEAKFAAISDAMGPQEVS
jgi:putative two-component system response regulator